MSLVGFRTRSDRPPVPKDLRDTLAPILQVIFARLLDIGKLTLPTSCPEEGKLHPYLQHYGDVTMTFMASQIIFTKLFA